MNKLLIKTLKIIGLSVLGLFLVLCLLILLFEYLNRESPRWAEVYDKIQVGMSFEQVENIIESIQTPLPSKTHIKETGHTNTASSRTAGFYIFYRGPNEWQYRIYFDDTGEVVDKIHWWD